MGADDVTASTSTAYATPSFSSTGHVTTNSLINIFSSEQLQHYNLSGPLETDRNLCNTPGNTNSASDLILSKERYQQFIQMNHSQPTRELSYQADTNELQPVPHQNLSEATLKGMQPLMDVSPLDDSRPTNNLPKTVNASAMLHESFGLYGVPLTFAAPASLSSSDNKFGQSLIMATTTVTSQSTAIPTLTDRQAGEVEKVATNVGNESDVYLAASAAEISARLVNSNSSMEQRSALDVEAFENTGTENETRGKLDDRSLSGQPDSSVAAELSPNASVIEMLQTANQVPSCGNGNGGDSRKSSDSDTSTRPGETKQSLLIKKQMTEMEKEFSRRFNNKNFKKIDEAELAQWFSDHGFPSFVAGQPFNSSSSTEISLSYRPPTAENSNQSATRPTLDQLRSSFSSSEMPPQISNTVNFGYPPGFYDAYGNFIPQSAASLQATITQINPQLHSIGALTESFPQASQTQHLGVTLTGGGLGLHGPAAFLTSPVLPQHSQPSNAVGAPIGGVDLAKAAANSTALRFEPHVPGEYTAYAGSMVPSTASNYAQHMPGYFNGFPPQFYRSPLPQQFGATNSGPSTPQQLPYATIMSPTMSNITSEMAAVLLQQIQQDNPGLIENLVDQQQRNRSNQATPSSTPNGATNNSTKTHKSPAGRLPAPPPPQNGIARSAQKHTVAGQPSPVLHEDENGWHELGKRHSVDSTGENKENGAEPIWVIRESYLKRLEREERRNQEHLDEVASSSNLNANQPTAPTADGSVNDIDKLDETEKLLHDGTGSSEATPRGSIDDGKGAKTAPSTSNSKKEVMVHEPAVLIEGVLFRARYLGSTQMTIDGRPTKTSRMAQAQEAVARVKAPSGEIQPSTEIDLFISTEKIMVLNTDLQRISDTDVRQDILMDHALRSISYIADIGDLVVLMARRVPPIDAAAAAVGDDENVEGVMQTPRVVCHVFESDEASFIAQSIGQAFQVAYVEFLRANGIDDPAYLREVDYQEMLNSQELMGEELAMFTRKETQKDIVIPKKVGEPLGVVVVESGWGSILPTVVVANMAPGGPASRSNQLNIGDQIIGINGISLVGLPLATAQQNIKNAKTSTAVRLTIVSTPPVVEVRIKRPNTKYQLGFSVQNGVICSLLRGGIAERGGIRVGHRIIEINQQSVVAVAHDRIVNLLATATGEIHMKTMPTSMFRLLTGQEVPNYI